MNLKKYVLLAAVLLSSVSGCKTQNNTTQTAASANLVQAEIDQCAERNHYSSDTIDQFVELSKRGYSHEYSFQYDYKPLLIRTVECGDLLNAKRLIEAGADVNETYFVKIPTTNIYDSTEISDKTALMRAAYLGNVELVQALIDAGAKVDRNDSLRNSGLEYKCIEGTTPHLKPTHGYYDSYYFTTRKTIHARGEYSALHYAMLGSNSAEVTKRLVAAQALQNMIEPYLRSLVELAIALERTEALKILIRAGVQITNYDIDIVAASTGNLELYKMLLEHKRANEDGDMSNHILRAIQYGRANIVEYLIEQNKDTFVADNYIKAAVEAENVETLEVLVKHGVDLRNYNTNNPDSFNKLVSLISPYYSKDDEDPASLIPSFGCKQFHFGMLEKLIQAGGITNEQYTKALWEQFNDCNEDDWGEQPDDYEYNVIASHINAFLNSGADPFDKDGDGNYPLTKALQHKYIHSAAYLIEAMLRKPEALKEVLNSEFEEHDYVAVVDKLIHFDNFNRVLNSYPELVAKLLKAGVDLYEPNNHDATIDNYAAPNTLAALIVEGGLLEKAPSVEKLNDYLGKVAESNCEYSEAAIKRLLDAGADINAPSYFTPLMRSIRERNEKLAQLLIAAGADVNAKAKASNNQTAMMIAAEYGQTNVVRALIEAGADINARNEYDETALLIAIDNGFEDVALLLIAAKADTNVVSKRHYSKKSILTIAIDKGQKRAALALIAAGTEVNAVDGTQYTPLCRAAKSNYYEIAKAMIEAGADVNAADEDKYTPLCMAATRGNYEVAKTLIEAGADVNKTCGKYGAAPLYIIMKEHWEYNESSLSTIDFAKLLLAAGADINIKNKYDHTPLHYAALRNSEYAPVIDFLIKAGADVNAKNALGRTPIWHSLANKDNDDVFKLLVEAGADIQTKDNAGGNLFTAYDFLRSTSVIQTLLDAGVDPNSKGDEGNTILHTILNEYRHLDYNPRDFECLELLIQAGADVNIRNDYNIMPLHILSEAYDKDHPEAIRIAEMLLKAGADINAKTQTGETPLYIAIKCSIDYGHTDSLDLIKLLIASGADVNAKTEFDRTAMSIAKDYPEIVQLLVEAGAVSDDSIEEEEEEEEEYEEEEGCGCGCGQGEEAVCPLAHESSPLEVTEPYYLNPVCQNFPGIAGCKY